MMNTGYSKTLSKFLPINLEEMRPPGFLTKINQSIHKQYQEVDKKHGWKNVQACPLCKNPESTPEFSKFDIAIISCTKCTMRYSSKIPVNLNDVYNNEGYLKQTLDSYIKNSAYRLKRFAEERVALIKSQLKITTQPKLLDVGCGSGWFLQHAKEAGMDVYGQDFSLDLVQYTSERLGIKVFSQDLSEFDPSLKFDVITLFDVIEHVEDPISVLNNCHKLLNTGGLLVIFTPNFDSYAIKLMKEHSSLICSTGHLLYFTKESFDLLTKMCNYSTVYFSTNGIDMGDLMSYYESLGDAQTSDFYKNNYNHIQPMIDAADSGNHMRFILKK